MSNDELDEIYTHLCRTLGAHGQTQAPLILARLSMLLITRLDEPAAARQLIDAATDGLLPLSRPAVASDEPQA
jgi:hypothetical protein